MRRININANWGTTEKDRTIVDYIANFALTGVIIFAAIAGAFFPIDLIVYAATLLSALGVGLLLKGLSKLPNSMSRTFLYFAGVAAILALSAALLLTMPALSFNWTMGLTAILIVSFVLARNFLSNPQSQLTKLPFLSKLGYSLSGLAFLGLTVSFSLIAAGVLPSLLILPILMAASLAVSVFAAIVTLATPAPLNDADFSPLSCPVCSALPFPPARDIDSVSAPPPPSIASTPRPVLASGKPHPSSHLAKARDTPDDQDTESAAVAVRRR